MAKLIDASLQKTILEEDNFFCLPATATERLSSHEFPVLPVQAVTDTTKDYLFVVPAQHSEFVSLSDIRFSCDLHVTGPGGVPYDDKVHTFAPVNNILHSLFDSVTIELNGRNISDTSKNYFLRAYLEDLFGFSVQAQKSQLTCAGWDLDDYLDDSTAQYGEIVANKLEIKNKAADRRRKALMQNGKLELSGKLHCDLFYQDKPLITGVEMVIKMSRSRTAHSFCAPTDASLPSVAVRNPCLKLRKFVPTPVFLNSVAKTLLSTPVKQMLPRVQMRVTTFASGLQTVTWNNLACGQLPKTIIIGLQSSATYNGSCLETTCNFEHWNLSYIATEVDGVLHPSNGYNMDYDTGCSLQAYEGLLDTLERLNEPCGELPFDRYKYAKGYTFYGFDLTVGHTGQSSVSLIRNGNLNVNFRFKRAINEAVCAVALLVFDNTVQINNNRQVAFDFAP
jgi:hypothetical protein